MENIDWALIPIKYGVLLFSLCVHETAHAWTAERCGDPSARLLGRVTLNPLAHADPIGTVVMPLIMMVFGFPFLFGWAKPVPFNPVNLNNIRRDPVLIAVAGPISNVAIAVVTVVLLKAAVLVTGGFETQGGPIPDPVALVAVYLVLINLVLFTFNLIPVPPLDGHYVLGYLLPPKGEEMLQQIGPMGIVIAIILARPLLGTLVPLFLLPFMLFLPELNIGLNLMYELR